MNAKEIIMDALLAAYCFSAGCVYSVVYENETSIIWKILACILSLFWPLVIAALYISDLSETLQQKWPLYDWVIVYVKYVVFRKKMSQSVFETGLLERWRHKKKRNEWLYQRLLSVHGKIKIEDYEAH